MLVPDPTLKPGEKKQVEKAHPGFDAQWYRYITSSDGTVKKESIFSHYEATANKFLVGGDVPTTTPTVPAANPFE